MWSGGLKMRLKMEMDVGVAMVTVTMLDSQYDLGPHAKPCSLPPCVTTSSTIAYF